MWTYTYTIFHIGFMVKRARTFKLIKCYSQTWTTFISSKYKVIRGKWEAKCTFTRNQPARSAICAFGIPSRRAPLPILRKVKKVEKCKNAHILWFQNVQNCKSTKNTTTQFGIPCRRAPLPILCKFKNFEKQKIFNWKMQNCKKIEMLILCKNMYESTKN